MNKSMVELLLLITLIVVFGCQMYVPLTWYSFGLTISSIVYGTLLYKFLYEKE